MSDITPQEAADHLRRLPRHWSHPRKDNILPDEKIFAEECIEVLIAAYDARGKALKQIAALRKDKDPYDSPFDIADDCLSSEHPSP